MYGFGVDIVDPYNLPETLFSSPTFIAHASRVVKMLESALTLMVQNNLEDLAEALKGLGLRHVNYGVQAPHYIIVETALMRTLAIGLGKEWTAKLRSHWAAVAKFITTAMRYGAESHVEISRFSGVFRLTALVSKGLRKLEDVYEDAVLGKSAAKRRRARRAQTTY